MDTLNDDAFRHLLHALTGGIFPFGPECPLAPDVGSQPVFDRASLEDFAHRKVTYSELAAVPVPAEIDPFDRRANLAFGHRLQLALARLIRLGRTARWLQQRLAPLLAPVLPYARLRLGLIERRAERQDIERRLALLAADAVWPRLHALARPTPSEQIDGRRLGPLRKVARSRGASSLYILKSKRHYYTALGCQLKAHEHPVFKVGAYARARYPADKLIRRYRRRMRSHHAIKSEYRRLRERGV